MARTPQKYKTIPFPHGMVGRVFKLMEINNTQKGSYLFICTWTEMVCMGCRCGRFCYVLAVLVQSDCGLWSVRWGPSSCPVCLKSCESLTTDASELEKHLETQERCQRQSSFPWRAAELGESAEAGAGRFVLRWGGKVSPAEQKLVIIASYFHCFKERQKVVKVK